MGLLNRFKYLPIRSHKTTHRSNANSAANISFSKWKNGTKKNKPTIIPKLDFQNPIRET